MPLPEIALIISSTRPTRFADIPAQWMLKQAQARIDMTVEVVDLRDHPLPFFAEMASNAWVPSQDAAAVTWQAKLAQEQGGDRTPHLFRQRPVTSRPAPSSQHRLPDRRRVSRPDRDTTAGLHRGQSWNRASHPDV